MIAPILTSSMDGVLGLPEVPAAEDPILGDSPSRTNSSPAASLSSGSLSRAYTTVPMDDAAILRDKLASANERLADLESFYMACATQPGGILDRRLLVTGPAMAMAGVSDSSVLWTSTPFAAAMTKQWMRVLLVAFALVFAAFGIRGIEVTSYSGNVDFRYYRFTNLEMRDQPHGTDPSHHQIGQLGLLRRGCRLSHDHARVTYRGPSMFLEFAEGAEPACDIHGGKAITASPSSSDGWYFTTKARGSPDQDPVRFVFEGSNDGEEWTVVGASSWTRGTDGRPLYVPRWGKYPTPVERRSSSVFDMRPHWTWLLVEACLPWLDAVMLLMAAMFAHLKRAHIARNIIVWGSHVIAIVHLIGCIGSSLSGHHSPPLMFTHYLLVCSRFTLGASVGLEKISLAMLGDLFVVAHLVISTCYRPFSDFGSVVFGTVCLAWAGAGYTALSSHRKTLREARELVEPDMQLYNKVWQEVYNDPREAEALTELRSLVLRTDHSIGPPRQLNRQKAKMAQKSQSCRIMSTMGVCPEPGTAYHGIFGPFFELFFCKSEEDKSLEDMDHHDDESFHEDSSTFLDSTESSHPLIWNGSASGFHLQHSNSNNSNGSNRSLRSSSTGTDDFPNTRSSSSAGMDVFVPFGAGGAAHGLGSKSRTLPGTVDRLRPVKSLDQLFTQAVGMDSKLRAKVQQWAFESEGMFPVQTADGRTVLMQWEHICQEEQMLAAVKWGKIKKGRRAIEKLLRSHWGDISLLVDVCRQCIVFDSATQLLKCLRAIAADKEVIVERIKNRLHPDYNAKISAGYRDCLVNIRVVTESTCRMGIEGHVCEVQLLLRRFYELKSDEGHARYVIFRNFRGE